VPELLKSRAWPGSPIASATRPSSRNVASLMVAPGYGGFSWTASGRRSNIVTFTWMSLQMLSSRWAPTAVGCVSFSVCGPLATTTETGVFHRSCPSTSTTALAGSLLMSS
jgi:hypothetical protein